MDDGIEREGGCEVECCLESGDVRSGHREGNVEPNLLADVRQ